MKIAQTSALCQTFLSSTSDVIGVRSYFNYRIGVPTVFIYLPSFSSSSSARALHRNLRLEPLLSLVPEVALQLLQLSHRRVCLDLSLFSVRTLLLLLRRPSWVELVCQIRKLVLQREYRLSSVRQSDALSRSL